VFHAWISNTREEPRCTPPFITGVVLLVFEEFLTGRLFHIPPFITARIVIFRRATTTAKYAIVLITRTAALTGFQD